MGAEAISDGLVMLDGDVVDVVGDRDDDGPKFHTALMLFWLSMVLVTISVGDVAIIGLALIITGVAVAFVTVIAHHGDADAVNGDDAAYDIDAAYGGEAPPQ